MHVSQFIVDEPTEANLNEPTEANLNLTDKIDLCEDCAKEHGMNDPSGFSLADLLTKMKKLNRE